MCSLRRALLEFYSLLKMDKKYSFSESAWREKRQEGKGCDSILIKNILLQMDFFKKRSAYLHQKSPFKNMKHKRLPVGVKAEVLIIN